MSGSLNILSATADPALLDLPWHLPLDAWPNQNIAALPKGISRHLVRFAHLSGRVVAIKETTSEMAKGEYDMLRRLQGLDLPCVEPLAVITNRTDEDGAPLKSVLVTRHLKFSLPYRALYSQTLRPDTATRLVDALAVLLVRVHMVGLFWGDVSLSNTLFRRDAGAFAAYLVDAETGQLYPGGLSNGQRENDLEIARVNIAGELMDLEAGGRVADELDPIRISNGIVAAYRSLWTELTGSESFASSERWRITERVERLNHLGFDIEELGIKTDESGTTVRIQPKVVDAGHHQRRLLRLTGLDAEENQAGACSTTSTHTRPATAARMPTKRWSPTSGSCASSNRSCAPFPVSSRANWSRLRSFTNCSTTVGSWPSTRAATFRSPRPSRRMCKTCCVTAVTRSR